MSALRQTIWGGQCSSFRGRGFGRLGVSFGCCGFGFGFGRFTVAAGRSGWGGIFFGGFLVFITAIIGDVKAAAFEEQTSAAADGAFHFSFAPTFLGTGGFGAGRERFSRDGLKLVELVSALFADVFICRHTRDCSNKVNLAGQESFERSEESGEALVDSRRLSANGAKVCYLGGDRFSTDFFRSAMLFSTACICVARAVTMEVS
jgi:hypothetical protein